MNKTKRAIAASAGAFVVVIVVGYLLPALQIQQLTRRKQQVQIAVNQAAEAVGLARGPEFRALPSADETPELFKQIYRLADRHKVRIIEFSPRPILPGGAEQADILPLDIQMEAAYSSAGDFIGSLASDPEVGIVSVKRLDMVPDSENSGRLRLSVLLEFYLKADGSR